MYFEGPTTVDGSDETVYFESLEDGDEWDYVEAEGDGSLFKHAFFKGGDSGLRVDADGITVKQSNFQNNDIGVDLFLSHDNTTVTNNDISGSAVGVWISSNGTGTTVNGNLIENSSGGAATGIYMNDGQAAGINDNTIKNNEGEGIALNNGSTVHDLDDNQIKSNGGVGLYLSGGSSVDLAEADDNVIKDNQDNGVYVSGGSVLKIDDQTHNVIRNNVGAEVYVTGASTFFDAAVPGGHAYGDNDIYDGSGDRIYTNAYNDIYEVIEIEAARTYWGFSFDPTNASNYFNKPSKVDYIPYCQQSAATGSCNQTMSSPSGPTMNAERASQTLTAKTTSTTGPASAKAKRAGPGDWVQSRMAALRKQMLARPQQAATARRVRKLYGLMLRDPENALGERQANWASINGRQAALEQRAPQPSRTTLPTATTDRAVWKAGEMALVLKLDDLVRRGRYAQALSVMSEKQAYIVSRDAQVTVDQLRARALTGQGQYKQALAAIADAEAVKPDPSVKDFRAPNYEPMKWGLRRAMNEHGTVPEADAQKEATAKKAETQETKTSPSTKPDEFALEAAYPNPTNSRATLPIKLPEAAQVHAEVYDVMGRRVATLADGTLPSGTYRLTLRAGDLPAGVYVVRARVRAASGEAHLFTRKVTIAR